MELDQWVSKLANATLSVLPFDFVLPAGDKIVEATHSREINDTTVPFLHALAAFAVLQFRLTGDEDIVIGTNTPEHVPYVLRTSVTGETTFADLLSTITQAEEHAQRHAVPYADLAKAIQQKKKDSEAPILFRTAFLRPTHGNQGLFGATSERHTDVSVFYNGLKVTTHYNALLFKKGRMDVFNEQLDQLITQTVASPDSAIGHFSLITKSQAPVLPDPTIDLNWTKFGGAIHDIFSANASKHPDRLCVVETANPFDDKSVQRDFTYKQIDEASNVVAHHLVQSGVVIGDVVMIYAYRGVDLVVAVMGVLKAGATFSVIDPAYPPARQNIYLSVAKPQALIVLRKAGVLADLVKQYIADELQLKTLVPALELLDDGAIIGGSVDGSDILSKAQANKSKGTGVVVGPDCNPTLSFTSGSEGVPKGVRGRHFSLTYYFPWMSKTFNLTEKEKFTMLSGIAHDPIQRDIFTPLFLGAQLLVPTSDDIGTPGKLAEWMGKYGATVTHLTPAMGQLLSAQATAEIPSLHHAFFVGDILTKRDCLRLQALARNVAIVNMYGTTETQRSVSYYEVASLADDPGFLKSEKDVMPAGKGMLDVQLLVVNRNDRKQTCGVGEVGEIYVRAGGLAEGYLKLPDLTAEKFVTNWFVNPDHWKETNPGNEPWRKYWLGARDRLYRTGDLGRYRADGNVECCGRADDQVKIRGFRIELGEIDTHLSQHPNVRANVTLVRRNKDEEPVLVSYIVPQRSEQYESEGESDGEDDAVVAGLVRYRGLIKNIKLFLKGKLPSYAIPTVIVPLAKLPLNPNGKVDKPALPFPDTAQLAAVAAKTAKKGGKEEQAQFTETEAQIRDLWLSVLPNKPAGVEPSDSFFDIGGHSILATQMIFELRKQLAIDVPLGLIFKEPTIAGFAREIDALKSGSDVLSAKPGGEEEPVDTAVAYGKDTDDLIAQLPKSYVTKTDDLAPKDITVFLTGGTGFLGSFIIRDLCERKIPGLKIVAHVRAATKEAGLERLKNTGLAFGIWKDEYASVVEPLVGDLATDKFGLSDAEWTKLTDEVDVIIHNGAMVHWVYPYSKMRDANVIATINVMSLCLSGKPKYFTFVSSTSTVDTEHFNQLSDKIVQEGGEGIPESDDLEGSRTGLGNGYGQSKWAAEKIIRAAGKRGLRGTIVRPGYVVGDTVNGVSSTDDFLLRMVKGCIELGYSPDIHNTVNMVPVDHVARVVTSSAFHPSHKDIVAVAHVTSHPRLRFNEFLGALVKYGYKISQTDYIPWRVQLEKYVVSNNDSALYPLLHFVLDDLPQSTKAPELDDSNAKASLKKDASWTGSDLSAGSGVSLETVGIYLAYLNAIGFLPSPQEKGELPLPKANVSADILERLGKVGGRSSK
ncbi:L-2-aminoadipate reductase [Trichomonascus vanleenenianus]|uniref:L-aminoadipate-semialdehyde dehydrogenase n=1 Tax=Trichomonascus vanleenenianus TaxID=2268995 RepID=UPI003ECA68DF